MALTFEQVPSNAVLNSQDVALKGQRLIVTVYESDSAILSNTGFRYKVSITVYIGGVAQDVQNFYVQPNPSGYGIMDMRSLIDPISFVDSEFQGSSVHRSPSGAIYAWDNENNYHRVVIAVEEAWEVDGVLEDSPTGSSTPPSDEEVRIFAGAFQPRDGYDPDLSIIRLQGTSPEVFILTKNTFKQWNNAAAYGFNSGSGSFITIPTFQNDFGNITALTEGWDRVEYEIFDEDNVSLDSATLNIAGGSTDANSLKYIIAYPKSLSENALLSALGVTPDDYASDWKYYTLIFKDGAVTQVSPTFVLYKDCEPRYDVVRIGWANSLGGWDYFNFKGKDTPQFQATRKRYRKVLGTFEDGYNHNSWDRGVKDFGTRVDRYIEVTVPNMTADLYEYFVDLVRSKNIELIPQDASPKIEGLVLEDTNFNQEKLIKAGQRELTFRFRYANELW